MWTEAHPLLLVAGTWLAILSTTVACHRNAEVDPHAVASAAPSASAPPSEELSTGQIVKRLATTDRTAFDIVASRDGAVLIAARSSKNGSELLVTSVDMAGRIRREVATPIPGGGPVVEIAAAGAGERFAAAWITKTREGTEAFAALGDTGTLALGEASSLGPATIATSERGHIAVSAAWSPPGMTEPERFIVFHRGATVPCRDAPAGCVEFPLHEVQGTSVSPRRVGLAVPAPCGRAIAGFSAETTRWYYGVCALENGRAITTMFTIEYSPEYAEADRVLEGCVPIGATVVGGRALLVGRCAGGRRAVRLGNRTAEATTLGLQDVQASCKGGKLAVLARGDDALDAVLDGPTPDIAPVLPEWMAPADSRAIWTGKSLLVAAPEGEDLVVRRFACEAAGEGPK